MMWTPEFKLAAKLKVQIFSILPEFCVMTGIMDNEKVETQTLTEFINTQSTDSHCCAASASIGNRNSHFNVESDRVLVRAACFDGASQQMSLLCCASFPSTSTTVHFRSAALVYVACTATWNRDYTVPILPAGFMLKYVTVVSSHRAVCMVKVSGSSNCSSAMTH